jgi:hypothetical protein
MKSLVALGLGMTPEPWPDWLLERFHQGVEGEPVVLAKLREHWNLWTPEKKSFITWDDGQPLVEMPVGTTVIIRGHADALGSRYRKQVGDPALLGFHVVEVKCVTAGYAEEVLRTLPELYHWQMSVYGQALGWPVVLVLGVKGDDGTVDHIIEAPPLKLKTLAEIKLRVMEIERCIRDGEWPKCDYKQWPCRFPELCDDPNPEPTENWELEDRLAESLVEIRGRN